MSRLKTEEALEYCPVIMSFQLWQRSKPTHTETISTSEPAIVTGNICKMLNNLNKESKLWSNKTLTNGNKQGTSLMSSTRRRFLKRLSQYATILGAVDIITMTRTGES